jgi:hypothetical protein
LEQEVFEELALTLLELVVALMVETVEVHHSLEYLQLVVVQVEHETALDFLVVLAVVVVMLVWLVELEHLVKDLLVVMHLE